jgi:hypothetical protein
MVLGLVVRRGVWRILSCISIPCDIMLSLIVWMIAGMAERKPAHGES